MRISVVALALATAAVLVGCGAGAATALPAPPPGAPSSAAPSPVAPSPPGPVAGASDPPAGTSATPAPTPSAVPSPSPGQPVTVGGVVRAGARPGCDTLVADDGRHYLLLDVSDPPLGVPVEVTGTPDPTLLSYCNSGVALHVQRITRR